MIVSCPSPGCGHAHRIPVSALGERLLCVSCGCGFRAAERWFEGRDFVIYDLETTGLYPEQDEFIQIAAVRFRDGCLCRGETFHAYARPRRPISSFIENYTGVTNAHVRGAPRPEEVLADFAGFSGNATLIAHNGKRFDAKFLEATCHRHRLSARPVECIDSIQLSKLAFGRTRGIGHSMDHLMSRLGLGQGNFRRHDARGDVEVLGEAVARLRDLLGLDKALNGVARHQTLLPV
ncbi:MAG: exonuclease domain-containing protein [Verrucomicrobiales bacterium]